MTLAQPVTYIDLVAPKRISPAFYTLLLVICGSAFIAAAAQLAIPLPFTPVPVTGQSFAVLLIGIFYGSKRGAFTVIAYLSEGISGLPVFAGGTAGFAALAGPTGGYLIGFIFASYAAGFLAEKKMDRNIWTAGIVMFVSSMIIFVFGVSRLVTFVGFTKAIELGFLPFLAGDILKTVLSAAILPLGWKYFGKRSLVNEDRTEGY